MSCFVKVYISIHYLYSKFCRRFKRRRVIRTLVAVQSWRWLPTDHERAFGQIRHIQRATNRLRVANIAFSVRILLRAFYSGWISNFPQATSFSGLAVADIGCDTGQQTFSMLEFLILVFIAFLALNFACLGDNWDRALGWVSFTLIDGTSWDNLL